VKQGGEVTTIEIASVLLRRWRIIVGIPLVAAVVTAVIALMMTPIYTATVTFVPENRSQGRLPPNVTSLVGQFGITLGSEPTQSPRFYADVVRSRELLERVLLTKFPVTAAGSDSVPLLQLVGEGGRSHADSLARGVEKMNGILTVRADLQTNIIRLSVDHRDPDLAAAVANQIVRYLNDFNASQRQSQARSRRKFVDERVAAAVAELNQNEAAVRTFYDRNHGWGQVPELVFEENRLRRQVNISQEVYLTLKRESETARIEEVNDTPVFTVIDDAVPPQERTRPHRTILVALATLLAIVVGVLVAIAVEALERMRREPSYAELREQLQRARSKMPRVFRGSLRSHQSVDQP
jgi:uncharacterized protein involved in exopolysaccharide biosynthesis